MTPSRLFHSLLRRALRDERGAVTADWVVMTALVVGFAAALMTILQDPINNGGQVIANKIAATN